MHFVTEAFGRRCIPKFLNLLNDTQTDESTKIQTLTLLNNKLHDPITREEVELNKGVEIIEQLLFVPSSRIVALGCNTIEALSLSLSCRKSLIQFGAIQGLLHAINLAPVEATFALKRLLEKESVDQISIEKILENIKTTLNDSKTDLKTFENCLEILSHIAEDSYGLECSLKFNLPKSVCTLMIEILSRSSDQNIKSLLDSCSGYLRITSMTFTGKQAIREDHGIQVLGAILEKTHDINTLIKTTGALMHMSVEVPSKKIISERCLQPLIDLLAHEDTSIAQNVKTTLRGCCEDRNVSQKIQNTISPSEIEKCLGRLPTFAPILKLN